MNYLHQNNLRLATRNEGKIKSYDSCTDIRAWSHDSGVQDRYLREWMKTDMPICFIPSCIMTGCLRKMTNRSRRRAIPRCHPDCKSKLLLDTICNSCQAVKECLRRDEGLEKYFVEEELETSQWPCDKCLDALKSIKMFWKILLDKIFGINVSKCDAFETKCEYPDSVSSVARLWQSDIMQQTRLVQNAPSLYRASEICKRKTRSVPECHEPYCLGDNNSNSPQTYVKKPPFCLKKVSKCTSIRRKTIDCGCNTSCINIEDQISTYKTKISCLQAKYDVQNEDLQKLRKENSLLRKEVKNICNGCPWKSSFFLTEKKNICRRSVNIIPKPFESHLVDNCCSVTNIDSEMIITMKNGKNESFRYVSLLQVLHKTNDPIIQDTNINSNPCCKKEDPIDILNKGNFIPFYDITHCSPEYLRDFLKKLLFCFLKHTNVQRNYSEIVHKTVGAIVKREMCIANDTKYQPKKIEVDATFHRLHTSKSAPSCSTISSRLRCDCEANYACKK